jgi:EpsI family protein
MNNPIIVSLIMGVLMVLSGALTKVMTPTIQIAGQQDKFNLETMIPGEFDKWKIDPSAAAFVVIPDNKRFLNKIYNQTLSRTYINSEGDRVMLSIAYGRSQSANMHVHRPEVCYLANGFDIGGMTKTFVDTTIGRIPVMRLVANRGPRNEPITYWFRVGDFLTRGWVEQKLKEIGYGLTGKVPDGLLLRVSTISNDEQDSYRIQQLFMAAMLRSVKSEDRYWLVGQLTP